MSQTEQKPSKVSNTSIRIDEDLWKEAKKVAIDRGITVSELVQKALLAEMHKRRREQGNGDG